MAAILVKHTCVNSLKFTTLNDVGHITQ